MVWVPQNLWGLGGHKYRLMCILCQASVHILTHLNPHNSEVGIIIIIILKLMKAADPSAEKDTHTQFCTQIRGSHTATLPNPLSVAIKSSTPDNPRCL